MVPESGHRPVFVYFLQPDRTVHHSSVSGVIWLGSALLPIFIGFRVIQNDCSNGGEFSGCAYTLSLIKRNPGVCVGGMIPA